MMMFVIYDQGMVKNDSMTANILLTWRIRKGGSKIARGNKDALRRRSPR